MTRAGPGRTAPESPHPPPEPGTRPDGAAAMVLRRGVAGAAATGHRDGSGGGPAPVPADGAIAAHVADLRGLLRGPATLRRDLVAEVRAGLEDAADAHRARGAADPEAAAVAEFGAVDELAPLFQAELTITQVRRTALVVTVLFPMLLLGWDLLWSHGMAWSPGVAPPAAVPVLVRLQDVASTVVAGIGLILLLATLHRWVRPRLLAALTATLTLAGAAVCLGTAVAMNLANAPATAAMLATQPAAAPASAASLAAVAVVAKSAIRTLRLAR